MTSSCGWLILTPVVDGWYSGYGEDAGSGLRNGRQGPLFEGGNAYMEREFPKLDSILKATVIPDDKVFP